MAYCIDNPLEATSAFVFDPVIVLIELITAVLLASTSLSLLSKEGGTVLGQYPLQDDTSGVGSSNGGPSISNATRKRGI